MDPKVKRAMAAQNQLRHYEEQFRIRCNDAYPVGSTAYWLRGRTGVAVEIVEHSDYYARFKVRGATGVEYWKDAANFMAYERLQK